MTMIERAINPAVRQLERFRLEIEELSLRNPPTIVKSRNLFEITQTFEYKSLCAREKWNVWTDFDGVFTNPWSDSQTFSSLRAARSLVNHAQNVTIFTAKKLVEDESSGLLHQLSHMPTVKNSPLSFLVYPRERVEHYFTTLSQKNTECSINIISGLKKLVSKKEWEVMFSDIRKSLEASNPTVIIGSSYFDRKRIHKFILDMSQSQPMSLSNLYYFDTQHFVV